ncbi:MAG: hypothetical protein PHN51_10160 [Candidatus Nanopelagicales bacterium]|nr:hypothetical protein [Candidatus Nanopelagicales bacterium]
MDLTLHDPYLEGFVSSLVRSRHNTVGVYTQLTDQESVLRNWRSKTPEPSGIICDGRYRLYQLWDVDIGIVSSLSRGDILSRLAARPELSKTPVYLRYAHGNLFSVILQEELPQEVLYCDVTTIVEEAATGLFHHAKIGKYFAPNRLFHGGHYDGIDTTLEKTSKANVFRCYTILNRDSLFLLDMPF